MKQVNHQTVSDQEVVISKDQGMVMVIMSVMVIRMKIIYKDDHFHQINVHLSTQDPTMMEKIVNNEININRV